MRTDTRRPYLGFRGPVRITIRPRTYIYRYRYRYRYACICMCTSAGAYRGARADSQSRPRMRARTYAHAYAHTQTHTRAHAESRMQDYECTQTWEHGYKNRRAHARTPYACTHMHTHAHRCADASRCLQACTRMHAHRRACADPLRMHPHAPTPYACATRMTAHMRMKRKSMKQRRSKCVRGHASSQEYRHADYAPAQIIARPLMRRRSPCGVYAV